MFEGEAFSFEENFFNDECELGESCGPCNKGLHGAIRSTADFPVDLAWRMKITDLQSWTDDFGLAGSGRQGPSREEEDSDGDESDSQPKRTELVFT